MNLWCRKQPLYQLCHNHCLLKQFFAQVYIAEIAQPQHRGWLCSLTMPVMALGTLVSYSLGAVMSWHYVAVVGGCVTVILLIALAFISDSPYWYMQQGDDKKACQVIIVFNGPTLASLSFIFSLFNQKLQF